MQQAATAIRRPLKLFQKPTQKPLNRNWAFCRATNVQERLQPEPAEQRRICSSVLDPAVKGNYQLLLLLFPVVLHVCGRGKGRLKFGFKNHSTVLGVMLVVAWLLEDPSQWFQFLRRDVETPRNPISLRFCNSLTSFSVE